MGLYAKQKKKKEEISVGTYIEQTCMSNKVSTLVLRVSIRVENLKICLEYVLKSINSIPHTTLHQESKMPCGSEVGLGVGGYEFSWFPLPIFH